MKKSVHKVWWRYRFWFLAIGRKVKGGGAFRSPIGVRVINVSDRGETVRFPGVQVPGDFQKGLFLR